MEEPREIEPDDVSELIKSIKDRTVAGLDQGELQACLRHNQQHIEALESKVSNYFDNGKIRVAQLTFRAVNELQEWGKRIKVALANEGATESGPEHGKADWKAINAQLMALNSNRLAPESVMKFSGNFEEFKLFWASYNDLVLNNASLTSASKFRMLCTALQLAEDRDMLNEIDIDKPDLVRAEQLLVDKYVNSSLMDQRLLELVEQMEQLPFHPRASDWERLQKAIKTLDAKSKDRKEKVRRQLFAKLFLKLPQRQQSEITKARIESMQEMLKYVEEQLSDAQWQSELRASAGPSRRGNPLGNRGGPAGRGSYQRNRGRGGGHSLSGGTEQVNPIETSAERQQPTYVPYGPVEVNNPSEFVPLNVRTYDCVDFASVHWNENQLELLPINEGSASIKDVVIKANIDGIEVDWLFDTGAKRSLLPAAKFQTANMVMKPRFRSASGHPIMSSEARSFTMVVNQVPIEIEAYVTDLNLTILGLPFTGKCNTFTNGYRTVKIVYHDKGKQVVVYHEPDKEAKNILEQHEIYLVLPCAGNELIDDILSDAPSSSFARAATAKSLSSPQLTALLEKWKGLGQGLGDAGEQEMHRIYLEPGTKPISQPTRRFPLQLLSKARETVNDMWKLGVIENSKSPWCFNIVPVKKTDGTTRITNDFKALNAVSKKDAYPMPRIDEIYENLSQATVFSKLDLLKGYYQIRLHPDDREKTAFRFEGKLYQFKRVPMGLHSAPQTFQRLMNQVLSDLPFAKCYLDDIIVFSKNLEEHVQHLEAVFMALHKANLRVHRDKCVFAVSEVEFLGNKIGNGCRSPTREKIEKILNFPIPTCKKELDAFLGVAGQYRALIKDFSLKAQPLQELKNSLTGNRKIIWKPKHEEAMKTLKDELTRPPVVALPDVTKPFIVRTDASNTGMGAVLMQEIDGHRRVIEYASAQFDDTQKRYPTIEQEATAIIWALNKWQYYLLGGNFTLETDHRPLQFINSKTNNSNGKLARMALRLQDFQPYKIVHIPGKENVVADALSRMVARIEWDYSEHDDIYYRRQQKPNEFINDELGRPQYVGDGNVRLAVPRKHRMEVMKALHDDHGHFHKDRVLELAQARFYWKNMNKDLKAYCKACHKCALNQDNTFPKAEMKPTVTEVAAPFERWHFDVIGPLPASKDGSTYILVAQDAFSKWPEAKAVTRCPTTKMITDWLYAAIVCRFGVPEEIMTDRGSQLESKECLDWMQKLGIKHLLSVSYHHQTNGVVERFNRTLEARIRTAMDTTESWNEVIDQSLFAYRTTVHSITGKAPFEVVNGTQARLTIDAQLDLKKGQQTRDHQAVRQVVKERIQANAIKAKEMFDKNYKTKWRHFNNEKVYVKEFGVKKEGKLAPRCKGPFLATNTDVKWNYQIRDREGNEKTVHINQLKPCHNPNQPLADGLRGRGRPPRRFQTRTIYASEPRMGGRGVREHC